MSNELLSEDVYVSSLTISSTTHRTYSLRNDSRLSNPPSRGSRATSRVLNRMSSRGNDQTNSTISTRYRTTVGRKEDNSNVFARRESRRAFGACIPVHIYTQLRPPKKSKNKKYHQPPPQKASVCYQFLNKSPELKARPKTPASLHVIGK